MIDPNNLNLPLLKSCVDIGNDMRRVYYNRISVTLKYHNRSSFLETLEYLKNW